jgi:uncharacterized lipoprotein YddW (UPF0748 family)
MGAAALALSMSVTAIATIAAAAIAATTIVAAEEISVQGSPVQEEFRGVWIATVANTDWPSKRGLSIEQQKDEFMQLLDSAAAMNLNAAVVQVRPTCDTFYPSALNPWSEYLTGKQGQDPGYDPLAFMIEETHKRGMEFHAWFNPFRVSTTAAAKTWAENSVAVQHPDWVVKYGTVRWLDPGLPEVRDYAVQSVMEVVENYDIDAVHFDDYFYPYPEGGKAFPDKNYNGDPGGLADWRRQNINDFIQKISIGVKERKSSVKFGVSPFGIWRSNTVDAGGSDTPAQGSYDTIYADARYWVRSGWLDYIAPQIYWEIGHAKASYDKVLAFWVKEAQEYPRTHLYIGQAAYRIGNSGAWRDPEEMIRQLRLNRASPAVKGSIYFSVRSLRANPLSIRQSILTHFYQSPAQIPAMPWLEVQNYSGE